MKDERATEWFGWREVTADWLLLLVVVVRLVARRRAMTTNRARHLNPPCLFCRSPPAVYDNQQLQRLNRSSDHGRFSGHERRTQTRNCQCHEARIKEIHRIAAS